MRKVMLKSPFHPNSGYGNDGIALAQTFMDKGWDVFIDPQFVGTPLPVDIAMLLTREPEPPFDLLIAHQPPADISVGKAEAEAARVSVGWTMYEWEGLGPEVENFKERTQHFDLFLSYDPVSFRAVASQLSDSVRHEVLQGGYRSEDWPHAVDRQWFNGPFRFCMVGALHDRKDPFAAIRAFDRMRETYGPDDFHAELHLKTVVRSLHPSIEERYPGVKIHCDVWPQERLFEFYSNMHCLLAPSRGEGKNLPALEAMSSGIPTIATNYGGHTMWLSNAWAWPVDFSLNTTDRGTQAKVDDDALYAAMCEAYEDRGATKAKGDRAAANIPIGHDWDRVVSRLMDKVNG